MAIHPSATVRHTAVVDPTAEIRENATVDYGAVVHHHTTISKGAYISRSALIGVGCWIGRDATVGERSVIGDRVQIPALAWIPDSVTVARRGDVLLLGPALSSGRMTTAVLDARTDSVVIQCGCFCGNLDEFKDSIRATHAEGGPAFRQYKAFHAMLVLYFNR